MNKMYADDENTDWNDGDDIWVVGDARMMKIIIVIITLMTVVIMIMDIVISIDDKEIYENQTCEFKQLKNVLEKLPNFPKLSIMI